jgi:hypothetical protein
MLNKIKSFFKKKESKPISEYEQYIIDVLHILNEYIPTVSKNEEDKETERREKLWKEAEETLFQMKKVKRASEKVYEKILITDKMYKDSLNGNK